MWETIGGWTFFALVALGALAWVWWAARKISRLRVTVYDKDADTLVITWDRSGDFGESGGVIQTVTVTTPVQLVYGRTLWQIVIPDAAKLHDRANARPTDSAISEA